MAPSSPPIEALAFPSYWDTRYARGGPSADKTNVSSISGDGTADISNSTSTDTSADASAGTPTATGAEYEAYDWFRGFDKIRSFLLDVLAAPEEGPRIVQLGCGNSTLTHDLYKLGYHAQTNIDFSPVIINLMKAKYASLQLPWLEMDIRAMSFPDSAFDIAIDKGTMDAMLHGSLWDPEPDVRQNVDAYMGEVSRVLGPRGVFVYITYRQRHFIRPLVERPGWDVESVKLSVEAGEFDYFMFVMRKGGREQVGSS